MAEESLRVTFDGPGFTDGTINARQLGLSLVNLADAWETLQLDEGTGMADWWRNHADPTMRALFYSKGPFKGCTATKHAPEQTLTCGAGTDRSVLTALAPLAIPNVTSCFVRTTDAP